MMIKFDGKMSEISCVIYHNVAKDEIQGLDRERVELMVEFFKTADDFRTQTDSNTNKQQELQCTGSDSVKNRSHRSVLVCLVVLCVLLLTAVIVLCVLCYKSQIKTKNLTKERDESIAKYNKTIEQNQQLNQEKNELLKHLHESSESSFHFISSERKSWTESRRFCRERGADLIIINNKEEQDFVSTMTGTENIWIGLSDIDVEGTWKWVDGSTLTLSFWKSKQPDNRIVENCAVNHLSVWSDYMCHVPFRFVCEKK
ncbi:CD209 antigen-like protein E isoform X1 [Triplophysa dalaica]|uniref:CD209 antigen-like protein E isoform X1 n=1 Tax=Triplophysa dalaica TaxID=1582913 RepID=UPI0024DF7252|nr:CD209 antigen-like protein E isoform X1 [Triplophysa dalaica]